MRSNRRRGPLPAGGTSPAGGPPLRWGALLACALLVAGAAPNGRARAAEGAPGAGRDPVGYAGMLLEIREGRVAVAEVAPGSAAAEAGVLPLDVLLEVDGRSLVDLDPIDPEEILALFRRQEPDGHRIVLGRGGGTLTVVLKDGAGERAATPVAAGTTGPPAAPAGPPRPGTPAPPFAALDHAGREITLESLRGRLVLIDFWASWCAPCRAAELTVRRLAQEHEGRLVVVGISLDTDRKAFEAFVYNHHLPGHQVFEGGRPGPIGRRYGVTETGIPFAVLVDAGGRVAASGGTFQAIEAAIRAAAPAASPAATSARD